MKLLIAWCGPWIAQATANTKWCGAAKTYQFIAANLFQPQFTVVRSAAVAQTS
jgi:hypothetical protein